MPLKGFSGDIVQLVGTITLSVLVVKAPSSYNVRLGRPTLNNLRAVTLTYHLNMKFPTP